MEQQELWCSSMGCISSDMIDCNNSIPISSAYYFAELAALTSSATQFEAGDFAQIDTGGRLQPKMTILHTPTCSISSLLIFTYPYV